MTANCKLPCLSCSLVYFVKDSQLYTRVESCTPQHSTALFVLCCVLCCIWKLNFECCEKLCNYCTALWKLLWKSAVFWQKSSKIGLFRRENFESGQFCLKFCQKCWLVLHSGCFKSFESSIKTLFFIKSKQFGVNFEILFGFQYFFTQ